jgi:hypothetical protein
LVCVNPAGQLGTKGCKANGVAVQDQVIRQQQQQIKALEEQNQEFQQRLSRLESVIAKK